MTDNKQTLINALEKIEQLEQQNAEMLEALIKWQKWHYGEFETDKGCNFDCKGTEDCYECIHNEFCDFQHLIEKITGKKWSELCY